MSNLIMFQVSEIIYPDMVYGRNCGNSIKVGMCFNKLQVSLHEPKRNRSTTSILPDEYSLKVLGVEYLRKNHFEELTEGCTGGLFFSESDIEEINKQLKKKDEREYLELIVE